MTNYAWTIKDHVTIPDGFNRDRSNRPRLKGVIIRFYGPKNTPQILLENGHMVACPYHSLLPQENTKDKDNVTT